MLRRIEAEEIAGLARNASAAVDGEPLVAPVAQADLDANTLPHDHPRWVRDAIAISQRARDLVVRLKPVLVRVMSLWDHRLRHAIVGNRRVHVDYSGSYRVDG